MIREMSTEANSIIFFMIQELSTCKYFYRSQAEGAYDVAIFYKYPQPKEDKSLIVDEFFKVFERLANG